MPSTPDRPPVRRFAAAPVAFVGLLALLIVGPPHAARAADALGPAPQLFSPVSQIEATDDFVWNLPFTLRNATDRGLYSDSLMCDVDDLDPGQTRASRHAHFAVPAILQLIQTMSAGDSSIFQCQLRASAEHARLRLRLYAHDAEHHAFVLEAAFEALPNALAQGAASRALKTTAGSVEFLMLDAPAESTAVAGILLVHDDGQHARTLLPLAADLRRQGFAVASVSLPGYGTSEGEPDAGGARSQAAIVAALGALEHAPRVDAKRVTVWGNGIGATAAARVATERVELRALVAQSGAYDAATRQSAARVKGSVLVLHGEKDTRAPAADAHALVDALKAAHVTCEAKFYPSAAAMLPPGDVRRTTLAFLQSHGAR
jgi:dienelactone hydrolase